MEYKNKQYTKLKVIYQRFQIYNRIFYTISIELWPFKDRTRTPIFRFWLPLIRGSDTLSLHQKYSPCDCGMEIYYTPNWRWIPVDSEYYNSFQNLFRIDNMTYRERPEYRTHFWMLAGHKNYVVLPSYYHAYPTSFSMFVWMTSCVLLITWKSRSMLSNQDQMVLVGQHRPAVPGFGWSL